LVNQRQIVFFGVMLVRSFVLGRTPRRVEAPHHGMEVDRASAVTWATVCNFRAVNCCRKHHPLSLLLVEIAYGRPNRPELAYRFERLPKRAD
jgi:hypothetical protein